MDHLNCINKKLFVFLGMICGALNASASDQVGTITQVHGEVKLFTHPSKSLTKESVSTVSKDPRALFEGVYYRVREAQIGDKVELGNIVRTAPRGRARIIFDNGDQFTVGSGSAYRVHWEKDDSKTSTHIQLMYGKFRGVIEKGGPRSRLQLKTRNATLGVRGTDFFVAEGGADAGTEISIIRGKVEVTPDRPQSKPIEVATGFSIEVPPASSNPIEKTSPPIKTYKTTQEDLKAIQKSTVVKVVDKKNAGPVELPTQVARLIEKLEKKAINTTFNDIKISDPSTFAQLDLNTTKSSDDLNGAAVQYLIESAPKAPTRRKPYRSELDDLEEGAYDKYFKSVD